MRGAQVMHFVDDHDARGDLAQQRHCCALRGCQPVPWAVRRIQRHEQLPVQATLLRRRMHLHGQHVYLPQPGVSVEFTSRVAAQELLDDHGRADVGFAVQQEPRHAGAHRAAHRHSRKPTPAAFAISLAPAARAMSPSAADKHRNRRHQCHQRGKRLPLTMRCVTPKTLGSLASTVTSTQWMLGVPKFSRRVKFSSMAAPLGTTGAVNGLSRRK